MRISAVCGAVLALSSVAAVIFVGVALQEINYVSDHPYRYGPARVIAWGAGGGIALALAVAMLAWTVLRSRRERT